jgi:uncharacterized protein (TIGR03437 family)
MSRCLSCAVLIALAATVAVRAQPQIDSCEVFPANNVWNAPVDKLPVDANSAQYVATIGANAPAHPDFGSGLYDGQPIGIPFATVPGTQPKVPVSFQYADESDPGPYPIPPNVPIEGGAQSTGDRHVLVIDADNCILYEMWSSYPQPDGSWQAGSGAIFHLKSNALRPAGWTSADAAGLPIFPGLVRYDEVAAGAILHAIRFTAPQTRDTYIWPGRHEASNLPGNNYPPMGQRFRLKATINISGFSPTVQVILTALKKYGMILADNGSSWYLSGATDDRWDNDTLHEIAQLQGSDFEAVNESSLMMQADSGQVKGSVAGLAVTSVENSASDAKGAVSPGELVTLMGSGFDAETQVTFSGHKAPVIYTSAGQINLVTPYEITGEPSTSMVVTAGGVQTSPQNLQVVAATPGIFMVINPDGKANSAKDPAPQGRAVVLYATGGGQTTPPGVDGQMEGTTKLPKPVLPVSVTVGGKSAKLVYAGAAPKMIAGTLEVKLEVPTGIKSGSAVPLVLDIGGFTTTLNVAIQ